METFADRIRASVAGVTLSIDRGARTPGLCEIGAAGAGVVSLTVRGLEMYGFDFDTSRYESFDAHIASAGGLAQLLAGAEETPAQLLTRLGGEIAAAMQPEAPDSERERVFGEVVRSLAVPLREAPERLYLELATGDAGARWFVLEGAPRKPAGGARMHLAGRIGRLRRSRCWSTPRVVRPRGVARR